MKPETRIDWPALLGDIAYLLGEVSAGNADVRVAVSAYQLADALDVARSTLRGWLDGSEPKHTDGERLLLRWCALTHKGREFAPRERPMFSASRAR